MSSQQEELTPKRLDKMLMPINQAYSPSNFNTSLNLDEIDEFRKPLVRNIAKLNLNKYRMRAEEYNQLINYHYYCLNILNNMSNIKEVELANPYNRNMQSVMGGQAQPAIEAINPYEKSLKVIYRRDGTTKIISPDELSNGFKQEWETQFDSILINPPQMTLPPNNCFALPRKG